MRRLLSAIALAASIHGIACHGSAWAQGTAPAQPVVNVVNWADYVDPSVLDDFTAETGIRVVYDTFESSEALEAKLTAGRTGYDVVVVSAPLLRRQMKAGLLQKLDRAKLPHAAGLSAEVMTRLAADDPGNQFAVNYMWFTAAVVYNEAKARQRLGGADPQAVFASWEGVFRPDILKKFADCGIAAIDNADDLAALALRAVAARSDPPAAGDVTRALEALLRVRPFIKRSRSAETISGLARGELCLALAWSNDGLQARRRAAQPGKGAIIGIAVPRDGTLIATDNLAIPSDAPHVDAAHRLIDFLLRPEIAARDTNATGLASGVAAAQALVDPALRDDSAVYPPQAVMAQLFTLPAFSPTTQQVLIRFWATRNRTGK